MEKILLLTQVIISIILGLLVLIQGKDEGFSASGGAQSFKITRRGPEKVIFIATIVFATLFLVNAVMFVFVK
jgi:protein translocase SecG subunit